MPTPAKKYPYAIVRNDNSYNVYDITRADYGKIKEGLLENKTYTEISIGLLRLDDIRSVIEQKEEVVQQTEEKPALPPMSPEERTYYNQLKEMGMFDMEVDE